MRNRDSQLLVFCHRRKKMEQIDFKVKYLVNCQNIFINFACVEARNSKFCQWHFDQLNSNFSNQLVSGSKLDLDLS